MAERAGRLANPEVTLDRLLAALMEPTGGEARRSAAEAEGRRGDQATVRSSLSLVLGIPTVAVRTSV